MLSQLKIFEPLVINFVIIFMPIPSNKKICEILKSSKTEFTMYK